MESNFALASFFKSDKGGESEGDFALYRCYIFAKENDAFSLKDKVSSLAILL